MGIVKFSGGKGGGNSDTQGKNKGEGFAQEDVGNILPKVVDITLVEQVTHKKDPSIKEKRRSSKKRPHSKFGYYGVGISLDIFGSMGVDYNGQHYFGIRVGQVSKGNPADEVGLQVGDLIFLINGIQYNPNSGIESDADIMGKGPKDLVLGISRGGHIMFINVRRDWIETSGGSGSNTSGP